MRNVCIHTRHFIVHKHVFSFELLFKLIRKQTRLNFAYNFTRPTFFTREATLICF